MICWALPGSGARAGRLFRTRAAWHTLLCVVLWLLPRASPAVEAFRVFSEPVLASALIGMEVRDSLGKRIGTLRDLTFDLRNNRVHYVVLESGGKHRKLPMHAFTLPSNGARYLVLDLPQANIETAWEVVVPMSARKLVGHSFGLPQEPHAGRVVDVALDAFWGEVAFAAVRIEGHDSLRPTPLDAFARRRSGLEIKVSRRDLAALPAFKLEELERNLLDRHFLQNTTRLAHQLTPLAGGPTPRSSRATGAYR